MWATEYTGADCPRFPEQPLFDDAIMPCYPLGYYFQHCQQRKIAPINGLANGSWILEGPIFQYEYMAEGKKLHPVNFDAQGMSPIAKDAGMKYIVRYQ